MADNKTPDIPGKPAQPVLDNKTAKDTPPMPGGSPPIAPATKEAAAPNNAGKTAPPDIPAPAKVVPFDIISGAGPDKAAGDAKLQQEQEALLKALDEKSDSMKDIAKPGKSPGKQKSSADKKAASPAKNAAPPKDAPAPAAEKPAEPREAPRSAKPEQIVYLNLSELHAFKDHPFGVRDDKEMLALVESVKDKGVNQPALVRPRPEGGYEIVAGHRRQKASELAGFKDIPAKLQNCTNHALDILSRGACGEVCSC